MPKVSIIVPVYNVEKYIRTCLNSIITQSLKNIEIICVDDGSTDNCPAILDEYADKDKRIKVIHKQNSGYGNSINVGFDAAIGEYIGIVESDDYILPEMYEILYSNAYANDLDLIKSECIQFWDTIHHSKRIHVGELEDYFGKVLTREDKILFYQFYMNTWSGIYKRQFLLENGIRHNETPGAAYQDNGFWIQTMSMCKRAMWLSDAFYMYRQDNPAASVKSREKVLAMYKEYCDVEMILEKKQLREELAICRYYRMVRHRGTFIRVNEEYKSEYAQLIFRDWDRFYNDIKDLDIKSKDRLFDWIRDLKRKGRVEQIIDEIAEIKDKIECCNRIILYGAGTRAEAVCLKLYNMGYYEKIENICISGIPEREFLCGKPLICFDRNISFHDTLIIISVKSKSNAFYEIERTLRSNKVKNYIDSDTIIRDFYLV